MNIHELVFQYNNEKCKIPKKFNKIPISIREETKIEGVINYILKISYLSCTTKQIGYHLLQKLN